ncbi:hypothetical protein H0264_05555 [Nocardia huaxiensis]|uniref:MPT63-like domain-containing protein n=1 Tax=Nocardia huaxiensis TaxID=2755382 RepID=A0A7D6ZIH8_9NOCA|nr:hypothetical protein [Nocardia huaxiensis]QLY31779.1 hypothetical protein H0264_05555 [Nocardia huaxiensis]
MRIRTAVMMGATVAGAAVAATLSAGSAAALTPTVEPGFLGVELTHSETVALANSPIPGWLEAANPPVTVWIDPASRLPQNETTVFATFPQIIGEAAAAPQGQIGFALDNGSFAIGQFLG